MRPIILILITASTATAGDLPPSVHSAEYAVIPRDVIDAATFRGDVHLGFGTVKERQTFRFADVEAPKPGDSDFNGGRIRLNELMEEFGYRHRGDPYVFVTLSKFGSGTVRKSGDVWLVSKVDGVSSGGNRVSIGRLMIRTGYLRQVPLVAGR